MSAYTETELIERWLYSTLSNDTTLTDMLGRYIDATGADAGPSIFSGQAPEGAQYPLVYYKWLSSGRGDLYVNGAFRVWSGSHYQINAVVEGANYADANPIAKRLDALLSIQNTVPVTGGNINQCIRLFEDRRPRFEGAGQEFRELGAFWDVIAQAT